MGAFGSALKKIATPDNLYLLGATLKDISAGGSDNFTQAQQLMTGRQKLAQRQAAEQGVMGLFGAQRALTGPDGQGNPGETNGVVNSPGSIPSLRNPAVIDQLLRAQQMGVDIGPALEILKATQPDLQNANGFVYDGRDPSMAGKYLPSLEKGQVPLYDENKNLVAVRNIDGSVQAAAEMAGAVEGAKAKATAPYEFINTPTATGAPQVMSKATAAGGTFTGQAPGEALQQRAAAQAAVDMPAAMSSANNALDVIGQIRTHPGRESRTGWRAPLPAIPGTSGKDFDALVDQAKGQVFMEAFNSLKGGGQITEREGQAAQQAIARLDRAQSAEGFDKALNDLEQIIRRGAERAQQKARAQPRGAGPARADVEAELRKRGLIP